MKLPSSNWFQRRIVFLLFVALLLKYLAPEATWPQIAMFFGLGFAIWRLRMAVYLASLERLVRTPLFYLFDVFCVTLFFLAYRVIFFLPLHVLNALLFGAAIALLSAYRYQKSLKVQRAIAEQMIAALERQARAAHPEE